MTPSSPTGRQYTIRLGEQEAVITERGAALRSYRVGERDVIVPFGADELPPAMHGSILLPWPNRLADGRYDFDGETYQLPINEPARRVANHGLVFPLFWRVLEQTDASVDFALTLVPEPGYPFRLEVRVRYALDEDGLTVRLATTNTSEKRAPYGVGFHPWLSPGEASVDDCRLKVDAGEWLRTNERLLPVATEPLPAEKDFSTAREISDTSLDDGFASASYQDGRSWVRLSAPDGRTAATWMEPPLGYWQVCTGDFPETGPYERTGVAAEPMSCPANAFVSGQDLAVIEPSATHTVVWGLRLEDDTRRAEA
ncbi:aldose 1-epimerase family protein [Raineyella fluvialis]|uniref:Aldose epimerase n=1 Tax=Raineyella fluvialis TaxID=2662261 RepID=A0A5Q2FFF5_9ACTN|nr:aldose 1-epimerase family protein [Raineyella fluvialis]QGF23016.1 aldose epimerase [Raineyella fluvialis]